MTVMQGNLLRSRAADPSAPSPLLVKGFGENKMLARAHVLEYTFSVKVVSLLIIRVKCSAVFFCQFFKAKKNMLVCTSTDEIRRRTDPMLHRYWGLAIGKEGPNRVTNLFQHLCWSRMHHTRTKSVCSRHLMGWKVTLHCTRHQIL